MQSVVAVGGVWWEGCVDVLCRLLYVYCVCVPRMRKRMQRPARNYSVGIASWTTHTQRRKHSARRAAEDTRTAFLIAVTSRTGKYEETPVISDPLHLFGS